jgi:NTE family protein
MRALVLSGGSSKGAWMAGCLQHILGELEINYSILCGVSVGGINTAFLAQFAIGEEKLAAFELNRLWSGITTSKIYKRWQPFGRFHALWKKSFYDSSPLEKLIRDGISLDKIRSSGKKVTAGTVSISTGKYTIFDETSDNFVDAVIGGASFPGLFMPASFLGQMWTDGGVKELSPIQKAVDLGATEIDIIITSPETRIKKFIESPTTADIIKRAFDLSTDKIMQNDIDKVEMYNKLALAGLSDKKYVKLNILRPDYNLIEDLLDFSPKKIAEMMQKGYQDAKVKYIK